MLKKAFQKYKNFDRLFLHSNLDLYYHHTQYQKNLKNNRVTQSKSSKGYYLDNSMMESLFWLMKNELTTSKV